MKLYYHPLSTYSQKVLIAFYEKAVAFEPQLVNLMEEQGRADYKKIYPLGKIPLLVLKDGYLIPESSIIIEYLDSHYPNGTRLIPKDPDKARQVRFIDRMNDLYLNEGITTILFDGWKPEDKRNPEAVAKAKERLDITYQYLERQFAKERFCNGDLFSMSDCACLPPLFYAQQVYPFSAYSHIQDYFERVSQRPSYQKVLAEAQPYLKQLMA